VSVEFSAAQLSVMPQELVTTAMEWGLQAEHDYEIHGQRNRTTAAWMLRTEMLSRELLTALSREEHLQRRLGRIERGEEVVVPLGAPQVPQGPPAAVQTMLYDALRRLGGDLVGLCPHGAVLCSLCITEEVAHRAATGGS
jgi:hypothetical protein